MDTIRNNERFGISFQVRHLQNIPAGDFEQKAPFLVKNITEENISVEVLPYGQSDYIRTILYPGWNPEIFRGVKGVTANQLQYGY